MVFTELQKALLRGVKNEIHTKTSLVREMTYAGFTKKEVNQALNELMDAGLIYRVREGWLQTDWDGR